jgi:phosphonate transport system substrate-binding protein
MKSLRWRGASALALVAVLAAVAVASAASGAQKSPSNCLSGNKIRFGVEPYDTSPKFAPAYKTLVAALSAKLHCNVQLFITQNYTAEIEAMRAKKLDVGEFGPLGYIFAHKIANAQSVAGFADSKGKPLTYTAALWVPTSSSIQTVQQLKGHTIAFADPASTSGNLYPRYALMKAGLNPDKDVTIQFAGSHTASMLALVNGKVDAAELNSEEQATATAAHQFDASKFRTLWRSAPIPDDPITVRGDLPKAFQIAFQNALLHLSPKTLAAVYAELGSPTGKLIKVGDKPYQQIRDLVNTENLGLKDVG